MTNRLEEILSDPGLFGSESEGGFYAIVWFPDGRERTRSANAPADLPGPSRIQEVRDDRLRGSFREVLHFTPRGECLLVGRDISQDLLVLRHFAWTLVGACAGLLLLGLSGGWWISSRTLRPIADISAAAARIAGGDLSQRIETRSAGSELDRLTFVLNETFARLEAAFTRQTRFTADAAHELRTPVSVILTHVQNGLSSGCPNEEHRAAFEASHRAAQRMRKLIESLLALARIDSGSAGLEHGPCDLSQIAGETLAVLSPLADREGIALTTDLKPAPCQGNAEQLGQVVCNLVSNAINYNRPGGSIQVVCMTAGSNIVLAISDTGQGISAEDLPHLFERFYRVDKVRSSTTGRTGLGLAICKAIVEAHGGTLKVSSTLGQGSTFTVHLPTSAF
jgi:two-component system OmpR family sensor kinase